MKTSKRPTLVSQQEALPLYMDSLLGVSKTSLIDEQQHDVSIVNTVDNELKENLTAKKQVFTGLSNESLNEQQLERNVSDLRINQLKSTKLYNTNLDLDESNKIPAAMKQETSQQPIDISIQDREDEAPSLNLSLFLPTVPSSKELDLIEQKDQHKLNHELENELKKSHQVNELLKGQLEESLKKLDDYAKTHSEVYAPDWAQPSFQVVLFNVGNLKLALPLNDLNSIVVWDEKYITQMPGSAKWYLGLIQHQGKSVPVIDTLQQVIPPARVDAFMKKRGEFKNIIIFNNESWGLVCEDIIGIKTLAADEVKWRSDRTSRRWLHGTVKEHMCALLDSNEFASMLTTGDGSLIKK
ncbi:MAG: chemotaxis protein CheW [Pseudomonadota bacterium]